MTELETIQRAKMYMDKLANGINPIDDMQVPEDDTINNVRLSRCFFFVSDVLRRVIENGGVTPQNTTKKSGKIPFKLTDSERKKFEISPTPVSISEISKRLNALIDPKSMKRIAYRQIREWLSTIGMLEDADTISGGREKLPTEAGKSIGISVETRTGGIGDYQVVLYDKYAQQFILDNLDAILEIRISSDALQMHGKPWTKEQDEELTSMYRNGATVAQISDKLQRSNSGITSRLKKLGLINHTAEVK